MYDLNNTKACFITIDPAPCSNVFKAECSDLTINLRPSNPLRNFFVAALATLSLRVLNDGKLSRNCSLIRLVSLVFFPRIVDNFLSLAP